MTMERWEHWVRGLESAELEAVLRAVLHRYGQLCPDQEVCVLCVDRTGERASQIDGVIGLLERMKETE